jgi:ATP-dependent Clp protease ATP-binding subunit ClpC
MARRLWTWVVLGVSLSGGGVAGAASDESTPPRKGVLVFERYDTEALQVIFVARSEASRMGASEIDTEHLLLGVLRMGKGIVWPVLSDRLQPAEVATEIEAAVKQREVRIPESADMPLTLAAKAVLGYAEEEAAALGVSRIGAEHILLGLLREEKGYASGLLRRKGLQLDEMRAAIRLAR